MGKEQAGYMSAFRAVFKERTLTQRAQDQDQEQSEDVEGGVVGSSYTIGAARWFVWRILSPLQFGVEEADGQAGQ